MNEYYILNMYNSPKAVIEAFTVEELIDKTTLAIQEELGEEVTSLIINIGYLGDYGKETDITARYYDNGELCENEDITLIKTVKY